jgi:hypothetical protein
MVHAPMNHALEITKPVSTIYGMDNTFLDIEDDISLYLDKDIVNENNIEDHIQQQMDNMYSFLKN